MRKSTRALKPSSKVIDNNTEYIPKVKPKKQPKQSAKKTLDLDLTTIKKSDYDRFEPDNIFYKENLYSPNDNILKRLDDVVEKFGDKLNDGFSFYNNIINLDIKPDKKLKPKEILYSKLKNGDYHSATSKSDKNIAKSINTIVNNIDGFKKYKNVEDLTWIIDNHRLLFTEIIEYHQAKNNSIATIKTAVNAIVRIFGLAYNKQYPLYIKYTTILQDLNRIIIKNEGENILNTNEQGRYIDWKNVLKERDELEKRFNQIANKNTQEAYDLNQDLVLLSLYTLTPPLRAEIKTLKFTNTRQDEGDWVFFYNGDTYLELNEVKKKHYYIRIELSEHLANILKESNRLYTRSYVFTHKKKYPDISKQASIGTLDDRLAKIFYKYGVSVGSSILRSSYITYLFKNNELNTYNKQENISRLMRTSFDQIRLSYNKNILDAIEVDDYNRPVAQVARPVQVAQVARVVQVARPVVKNPYQKQLERNRQYHKNNKEKNNENLRKYRASLPSGVLYRRRLLSFLNNDLTYKNRIRPATYEKYNFKLIDGVYY